MNDSVSIHSAGDLSVALGNSPWRLCRRALLLLAIGISPAFAQPAALPASPAAATEQAVTVELTQSRVIQGPDGKEQLVDAASVKPGDLLEYRAVYSNRKNFPVDGLVVDLPIPEGLEYQPKTARPTALRAQAATKDGQFRAEPLTQQISGKTEPVPYSDYRSLRWSLGKLPAGGEAVVSARARVQTYAPAAVPAAAGGGAMPTAPPASTKP